MGRESSPKPSLGPFFLVTVIFQKKNQIKKAGQEHEIDLFLGFLYRTWRDGPLATLFDLIPYHMKENQGVKNHLGDS